MRIVLTGGGSGGHITPILALADELKRQHPDCHITYIGERGGKFAHLTTDTVSIDDVKTIFAGKLRRYHNESWVKRLLDIQTNLLNIRDSFFILLGLFQSVFLVYRLKPDVVFLKGGFVGVPVGLAAALWKKTLVTHDSDAMPGLANRLVSRWVTIHATGMPEEFYNYPQDKTVHVGVVVSDAYQPVNASDQADFKRALNINPQCPVLLVTGGSHGAQRLNASIRQSVPHLLNTYPDLHIIHQVGKGKSGVYGDYSHGRLQVMEFLNPMARYTGAADIVVTRAGANTLAELGVQGKACIVVPHPQLTGGHQLKNAEELVRHDAVVSVAESTFGETPDELMQKIELLLGDADRRQKLGEKLQTITIKDAAKRLALVIFDSAKPGKGR